MARNTDNIQSEEDYADTPTGWHERWTAELGAFKKASRKFQIRANKVVNRYKDDRGAGEEDYFKLNIFHSNIKTVAAMLYGSLPKVEVTRNFADADDDVARVAGLMLQRMLNHDIQRPADAYNTVLKDCLEDRLIPGIGVARIRYEVEMEDEEHEAIEVADPETGEMTEMAEAYTEEVMTYEAAHVDYIHWRDFAWSPCRTFRDKRWLGYRSYLTRDQLVARFGEDIGSRIPLSKTALPDAERENEQKDSPDQDAWSRAEIWEFWNEENYKVDWYCKDFPKILDTEEDPMGLEGFFPSAFPMAANITTSAYMPIPDYVMAQDLYSQIDKLETRIALIVDAVKVIGVYDASATALARMFVEGVENDMIPVDNWAMFAEKGGLNGTVDWFPVQEIAATLEKLVQQRDDNIGLLYQITGLNDIMRGGTSGKNTGGPVTATESASATKFGSIRLQELQEEFAEFASSLMRLKAQVISLHFSPETIIRDSNVQGMNQHDQEYVEEAIALLKNGEDLIWRIEVKSESIAMVDYAAMKAERTEFISGLSMFMQAAAPLAEVDQSSIPYLLEMLKWGVQGFKGSNEIEGVLDAAIEGMTKSMQQKAEQPPEPSPEEKMEQLKQQAQESKQQYEMARDAQKAQAAQQLEDQKAQNKAQEIQQTLDAEIQETTAISATKIEEIDANAEANILVETVRHEHNLTEEEYETEEIIRRERAKPQTGPS